MIAAYLEVYRGFEIKERRDGSLYVMYHGQYMADVDSIKAAREYVDNWLGLSVS